MPRSYLRPLDRSRQTGPRLTAEAALEAAGLHPVAGGTKYRYFALSPSAPTTGYFWRTSSRTIRLVKRTRLSDGKLHDMTLSREFYFGKLLPDFADKARAVLEKRAASAVD